MLVLVGASCGRIGYDALPEVRQNRSAVAASADARTRTARAPWDAALDAAVDAQPDGGPHAADAGDAMSDAVADATTDADVTCSTDGCGVAGQACRQPLCTCAMGTSCSFDCQGTASQCNVACAGSNSACMGDCSNSGLCSCGHGSSCEFTCSNPPCSAKCDAISSCNATCADGFCTCGIGSTCTFGCSKPPCKVSCDGSNPRCEAVCGDGICLCRQDSTCEFTCSDGATACAAQCIAGASCLLHCPKANAGTAACTFSTCWDSSGALVCPGGTSTVCGRLCPSPPAP
ncbi:MAG: hypothetical protein MJD61_12605 [Proteobacteria bacterium]|nr:hypothetical protein [Pseudomonadota bacterium]